MLPPNALSKSLTPPRIGRARSRTATHTAAGIGSTSAEIMHCVVLSACIQNCVEVAGKEWMRLRLDGVALLERTALGHTRKIDRYLSDMRGPQRTTHQSEKGAMGALLPVISSDGAMALPTRRCRRRLCPYSNVRILSRPTVLISTFILGPLSLVRGLFFGSVTQAYIAEPSPLMSRRRLAVATASCRAFCIWESVTPGPGRQKKYGVSDALEYVYTPRTFSLSSSSLTTNPSGLPPLPVPARAGTPAFSHLYRYQFTRNPSQPHGS
ncbi:hypothetical protein B0H13DRAFT_2495694 [Mycena leptocephala]|nr:hypothetical protein B0H13DRAFT_2495694 [Mycena leptocephala]